MSVYLDSQIGVVKLEGFTDETVRLTDHNSSLRFTYAEGSQYLITIYSPKLNSRANSNLHNYYAKRN